MEECLRLTPADLSLADEVAAARHADNVRRNRPPAYGAPDNRRNAAQALAFDIAGTRAELAFLKMAGKPLDAWSALVDTTDLRSIPGDVGRVQVRSTGHLGGALILHPADSDRACFVLIINRSPWFRFAGWIYGAEGKAPQWWREDVRYPAFFVPQAALRKAPRKSKESSYAT